MDFDKVGLSRDGFVGFVSVLTLRLNDSTSLPTSAGIYAVVRAEGTGPVFLNENPAGQYKGKDPTVNVQELEKKWVTGAELIYIGETCDLKRRIRELLQFGFGEPVAHWGGRVMWQIGNSEELLIAWRTIKAAEDPAELKKEILTKFKLLHGRLPFANWRT